MTIQIVQDRSEIENLAWDGYNIVTESAGYYSQFESIVDRLALALKDFGTTGVDSSKPSNCDFALSKNAPGDKTVVVVSLKLPAIDIVQVMKRGLVELPHDFQLVLDGQLDFGRPVCLCARHPETVYAWAKNPEDLTLLGIRS